MRRALLILIFALVVAVAATAAGCGGGGSSGGKRLTKSEFISKADGVCGDVNKKLPTPPSDLRKGFNPTTKKGTDAQYKEFGGYLDKVVKLFRGEVDKLQGIKPPADLQNTWDKSLATLGEAINELSEAGDASKKGDRNEVRDKLAESDKHGKAADKLAKQLGLTTCGSA